MSRKTASFAQLYDYITQAKDGPTIALAHNLPCPATDRAAVLQAFFDNDRLARPRKNGVRVFHEVLAFHPGDAAALSVTAMRDLAEFYLQLRAPRGMALAEVHFDQAHPHVHLMISAQEMGSGCKLRLSRHAFREVKQRLEAFQRARFPELSQSLCQPESNQSRLPALGLRIAASLATNMFEFTKLVGRSKLFDTSESKNCAPVCSDRLTELEITELGSGPVNSRRIDHLRAQCSIGERNR